MSDAAGPLRDAPEVLHLPDGWVTALNLPRSIDPGWRLRLPSGATARVYGVLLADGTSFVALAYPGGFRFVRLANATGYAAQEHYEGSPPVGRDAALIDDRWRTILADLSKAYDETAAELGYRVKPAHLRGADA